MAEIKWRVLFDETQKERGRITTSYSAVKGVLETEGIQSIRFVDFPITLDKLKDFNALVFPCPDQSKIQPAEIRTVLDFVSRGGGVVLLSHAGGDPGLRTNLNELAENFGVSFQNNQLFDERQNLGMENLPKITKFKDHPVTEGLSELAYSAGCSIKLVGEAEALAITSRTAQPPDAPVLAVSNYGNGKVVALGSYEMFRDRIMGGLNTSQNMVLLKNIFKWVVIPSKPKVAPTKPASKKVVEEEVTESSAPQEEEEEELVEERVKPVLATRPLQGRAKTTQSIAAAYTPEIDKLMSEVVTLRKRFDVFLDEFRDFAARVLSQGKISETIRTSTRSIPATSPLLTDAAKREELESLESRSRSLGSQLDYITKRYQAGALQKAEYAAQRARIRGEMRTIQQQINALTGKATEGASASENKLPEE
ncbi:MAG: DUF4350 domain-containing protein [Candidatus Freyarchaeum deiterrae]